MYLEEAQVGRGMERLSNKEVRLGSGQGFRGIMNERPLRSQRERLNKIYCFT